MVVLVLLGVIVRCSCLVSRCKCQVVVFTFLYKRLCSPGSLMFLPDEGCETQPKRRVFQKFLPVVC